jgi:hypothetical protein
VIAGEEHAVGIAIDAISGDEVAVSCGGDPDLGVAGRDVLRDQVVAGAVVEADGAAVVLDAVVRGGEPMIPPSGLSLVVLRRRRL